MRQSLSFELARELARFRTEAGERLVNHGPLALRSWLARALQLDDKACGVLVELFEAQIQWSEIPSESELLVEELAITHRLGLDLTPFTRRCTGRPVKHSGAPRPPDWAAKSVAT